MKKVKSILEQKNLNDIWLAERIGLTPREMKKYFSLKQKPSIGILVKIASVLNVDISEIMDDRLIG